MELREQPVVFEVPGDDRVEVRKGIEIAGMTADVYSPRDRKSDSVMVMVSGYAEEGYKRVLGCSFLDMRHTISWARLFAGYGFTAIAYANREPIADATAIVRSVRNDYHNVAVWATSGSGPVGLNAAREADCALLLYPYTLGVADAAAQFHFSDPALGADDVNWNVPMFIGRAGKDPCPGLNDELDRFVAGGLKRGLPLTLVNHPDGPHAFDLFDDSDMSRHVVEQAIDLLRIRIGRA
jgi:hypothetical protein